MKNVMKNMAKVEYNSIRHFNFKAGKYSGIVSTILSQSELSTSLKNYYNSDDVELKRQDSTWASLFNSYSKIDLTKRLAIYEEIKDENGYPMVSCRQPKISELLPR